MILFFDRSVGTKIPTALRDYLKPPVQIEWHQLYFDQQEQDDVWLDQVGTRGWYVIGQDHRYHTKPNELAAIKRHSIGVFYLWGCEAPRWETMRVFARAFDRIVQAAQNTQGPFLYRVDRYGRLRTMLIPEYIQTTLF